MISEISTLELSTNLGPRIRNIESKSFRFLFTCMNDTVRVIRPENIDNRKNDRQIALKIRLSIHGEQQFVVLQSHP